MTLGAVLVLGGMTGGRGDELSGSLGSGGPTSLGGFVVPALPENWSDLPFQLNASETTAYNSNIFAVPNGVAVPNGRARADLTSTSNFGLSTKAYLGGQQLFFDGNLGVIRYLRETQSDSVLYSFTPGVNWTLTSRCAGTISGLFSKSPSTISEQVGAGINYTTEEAINETGKCSVANGYSLVLNSGVSRTTNSNAINGLNNVRTEMVAAGVEYSSGPDTLTVLGTISNYNYGNRRAIAGAVGLLNSIVQHSFGATYVRQISPKLTVTAQAGVTGSTTAFTFLPKSLVPTFGFTAAWNITPKMTATVSATRTVAPPTTVIGNAEISYVTSGTLVYHATPKIDVSAFASAGRDSVAFTPALVTAVTPFATNTTFFTAGAGLTYTMTPFISAMLNASYNTRVSNHVVTPQDLITVTLNYKPY